MKKFVFLLFIALFAISCNNKQADTDSDEKIDTIWNEKVQDVFFDIKLGDRANREEIVSTLYNHGIYFDKYASTEDALCFGPSQSIYFSFGGLNWVHLSIDIKGGLIYRVRFDSAHKDKASAMSSYKSIKDTIETKYSPTILPSPSDSTLYASSLYVGKNNINAGIGCRRSESISHKIFIYTILEYYLSKEPKSQNDEL